MEFILLFLSSLLLTAAGTASSKALLDSQGNVLQRGKLYFVKSVMRGPVISGLTLETVNSSCPLYAAQEPFDKRVTRPLAFFPENPNDDTIRVGRTLYITSLEPTQCPESNVWRLDRGTGYVRTGGSASSAIGPNYSRFAIYKAGDAPTDYQIQACPCSMGSGKPSCRMACAGILGVAKQGTGTFYDLIGLNSNNPLTVNFVKAKEEEEQSLIRSAVMRPN